MVIQEKTPITLGEVFQLAGDSNKSKNIKAFIKNFDIIKVKRAQEMKESLKALDLIKLKDEAIVKIVDFMPCDASELNKIVSDVSLDQDEVDKILEVIKNN